MRGIVIVRDLNGEAVAFVGTPMPPRRVKSIAQFNVRSQLLQINPRAERGSERVVLLWGGLLCTAYGIDKRRRAQLWLRQAHVEQELAEALDL